MSFIYLVLAIVAEVSGTTCMKLSHGFTRFIPSVLLFVFYGCSFTLMTFALKKLEVSVVYAIWSGVGTAIIAAIGFIAFKEEITVLKLISIVLIIAGGTPAVRNAGEDAKARTPALHGLRSISASCTAFVRSRG